VHWPKGFFNHNGGFEYPMVLAVAALSVVVTGPGRISVDAWLGREYVGVAWGLVSLIVGSAGAVLQLASRHREPAVHPATKAV